MIALSTGTLHTYGTARVFELAAKAGYDGIEVLIDQRHDTWQSDYLRRLSREYGLPIVALHSPFVPQLKGWPADSLARLERTIALARELEVPLVVAHLPLRILFFYVQWFGEDPKRLFVPLPFPRRDGYYRFLADNSLPKMEAESGVIIAVENMPLRRFLGCPLSLYWFDRPALLARFPHLTLDTTHIGTWGWDLLRVYEQLKEKVAHVHLSNYDGEEHRALSQGRLPLAELLHRLAADRYAGAITVEGDPTPFEAEDADKCLAKLSEALAFCREHFRV